MKIDWNTLVPILTLALLALAQYLALADGGRWNPGLIGAFGLVLVMFIQRKRAGG